MDEFSSASVSDFNRAIKNLKAERDINMITLYQRGLSGRNEIIQRIDSLEQRINDLTLKRNQKVRKAYTRPVIDPATSVVSVARSKIDTKLRPTVKNMDIQRDRAVVKMTPTWFDLDDQQIPLKGIVYPSNTVERRPFNTIARYRMATGKSINFRLNPLNLSENSTETLILMLDSFAQQFGADLSFTKSDLPFDKSVYRTACGIADLGSAHLLAANYVSTAKFMINVQLDYNKTLTGSGSSMRDFLLNFTQAMAQTLNFLEDYIRVFSIEKSTATKNMTIIHFGITSVNLKDTQKIAYDFQVQANAGFNNDTVLQYIQPGEYSYSWAPTISYLQLRLSDFAPECNVDYRQSGLPASEQRGGYPFHQPIGWYYHALKMNLKYSGDDTWLDTRNTPGEWPIAFCGTQPCKVNGGNQKDRLKSAADTDIARQEAVKQMGAPMDQPGIYLTTHCDGGAHPNFTTPFCLEMPERNNKTFRLVFMCRVRPEKFTTHQVSVSRGHTWRLVDPNAVRPCGILIKNEDKSDKP